MMKAYSDRMQEIVTWLPANWEEVPERDKATLRFQTPWLEHLVITDAKVMYWEDARASLVFQYANTKDLTKETFLALIGQ